MKSPLHDLTRVVMLDLSTALASGRLQAPYAGFQLTSWVPKAQSEEVAAELERMQRLPNESGLAGQPSSLERESATETEVLRNIGAVT